MDLFITFVLAVVVRQITCAVYRGCYNDDRSPRVLSSYDTYHDRVSVTWCVDWCRSRHGTTFAGVESGNECYCGNSRYHSRYGSASYCRETCSGSRYEDCGGHWKIAIYSVCERGEYFNPNGRNGNCDNRCHCDNRAICDYRGGRCPGRCQAGWRGSSCQYRVPTTDATTTTATTRTKTTTTLATTTTTHARTSTKLKTTYTASTTPSVEAYSSISGAGGPVNGTSLPVIQRKPIPKKAIGVAAGSAIGILIVVIVGLLMYRRRRTSRSSPAVMVMPTHLASVAGTQGSTGLCCDQTGDSAKADGETANEYGSFGGGQFRAEESAYEGLSRYVNVEPPEANVYTSVEFHQSKETPSDPVYTNIEIRRTKWRV